MRDTGTVLHTAYIRMRRTRFEFAVYPNVAFCRKGCWSAVTTSSYYLYCMFFVLWKSSSSMTLWAFFFFFISVSHFVNGFLLPDGISICNGLPETWLWWWFKLVFMQDWCTQLNEALLLYSYFFWNWGGISRVIIRKFAVLNRSCCSFLCENASTTRVMSLMAQYWSGNQNYCKCWGVLACMLSKPCLLWCCHQRSRDPWDSRDEWRIFAS